MQRPLLNIIAHTSVNNQPMIIRLRQKQKQKQKETEMKKKRLTKWIFLWRSVLSAWWRKTRTISLLISTNISAYLLFFPIALITLPSLSVSIEFSRISFGEEQMNEKPIKINSKQKKTIENQLRLCFSCSSSFPSFFFFVFSSSQSPNE